jgi:hypothetical protein
MRFPVILSRRQVSQKQLPGAWPKTILIGDTLVSTLCTAAAAWSYLSTRGLQGGAGQQSLLQVNLQSAGSKRV